MPRLRGASTRPGGQDGEGRVSRSRRDGLSDGRPPQGQGRPRRHGLQPHCRQGREMGRAARRQGCADPEGGGRRPGLRDRLRRQRQRPARGDAGADGAFHGMGKGAVLVDHTTASAEIARELYAEAKKHGFGFVDAPVSGGQAGAENGVLTVMCGGDADPYARAEKVIGSYARMCKLLGPAGAGQLTKMVNQICIAGLVQGLAEGIHFAKKAGLDVEAVIDTISKGAAQSWQMENRYKTMAAGKFDFGFAVDWMPKDLAICMGEAR